MVARSRFKSAQGIEGGEATFGHVLSITQLGGHLNRLLLRFCKAYLGGARTASVIGAG